MWIVRAPLIWATEKETITVPPGFETDLASIPHMVRGVPGFASTGLSRRPAVLHDYLYASADLPRTAADEVFYRALRAELVPEPIARTFYRAVRLFGERPWRAHRRA
jgi:hypothetical protein